MTALLKECRFTDSSLEAITGYMYGFAQRYAVANRTEFYCVKLPWVAGYPHYLVCNRVFVVRPRPSARLSIVDNPDRVALDAQAVLLGVGTDIKRLRRHVIGRCLGDLNEVTQASTESFGCMDHDGMRGLMWKCDFKAETVVHYLPTPGCSCSC